MLKYTWKIEQDVKCIIFCFLRVSDESSVKEKLKNKHQVPSYLKAKSGLHKQGSLKDFQVNSILCPSLTSGLNE